MRDYHRSPYLDERRPGRIWRSAWWRIRRSINAGGTQALCIIVLAAALMWQAGRACG